MDNSFLDYYKTILQKVSFDQALFRKELRKALNTLDTTDATRLRNWLISRGLLPAATDEPMMYSRSTLCADNRIRAHEKNRAHQMNFN